MKTATTFRLCHRARPWTANAERRMHFHDRAALVAEWRTAFAILAREARVPPLGRIAVTAMPVRADRRSRPDVAACYGAVKAAIDGLVDAGVIEDDDPDHVVEVRFSAPCMGSHDALVLVVEAVQ
jgi:crossover junction endodeoxyribonuclease RusA